MEVELEQGLAQLSDPFQALQLASQGLPPPGACVSQRAPVPLFSQSAAPSNQLACPPLAEGMDVPCSQLDVVTTQDLITPVDQFQLDYDLVAPGLRQRSPAQLSPSRVKRARKEGEGEVVELQRPSSAACTRPGIGGSQNIRPGSAMPLGVPTRGTRRAIQRVHSPPAYRNMFLSDAESEQDFAGWRAQRQPSSQSQLPRFRTDFKEVGMLGQGSFSKVFRVRHRLDGHEYAVKRTIREVNRESQEFLQFIQEIQVLAHLPPHPGIVRYYSAWTEPGVDGGERLFTQLELCSAALGAHQALLGEALVERDLVEIARQIAAALVHLHAHGVAHMDVKPSNIYISLPQDEFHTGRGTGSTLPPDTQFKLGDFGQATRLGAKSEQDACVNEGDSRYLPLEVMNADYSRLDKADMFAFGATLYELASGSELPSGGEPYQDLRRGKVPLLPTYTTSLSRLIKALMSFNPDDRPSAVKVLQMPPLMKKTPSENPHQAPLPP